MANAVAGPLRAAVQGARRAARRPRRGRPRPGRGGARRDGWRRGRPGRRVARGAPGAPGRKSAAVLCRKRSQFAALIDALETRGIPYEVVGLGGLLLTPEVEDITALLHVVQRPQPRRPADAAAHRAAVPARRGRPRRADGLGAAPAGPAAGQSTTGDAPQDDDDAGGSGRSATDASAGCPGRGRAIDAGTRRRTAPTGSASSRRSTTCRVRDGAAGTAPAQRGRPRAARRAAAGDPQAPLPERPAPGRPRRRGRAGPRTRHRGAAREGYTPAAARAHLDAFADVAAGFTVSADRPNLGGFLGWLAAALKEERGLDKGYIEASPDAVQILTIHAAKGLEWDAVAVPGLVEGSFPALNYCGEPRQRHRLGRRRRQGPRLDAGACRRRHALRPAGRPRRPPGVAVAQRRGLGGHRGPGRGVHPGRRRARHRRGAPAGLRRVHPGPLRHAAHAPRSGPTGKTPRSPRGSSSRSPRRPAWPWNASRGPTCRTRTCPSRVQNPRDAEARRRSGPGRPAAHRATSPAPPRRCAWPRTRQGQDGRAPTQARAGAAAPARRGACPCSRSSTCCSRSARRLRDAVGDVTVLMPRHLSASAVVSLAQDPDAVRVRAAPADARAAGAGGSPRDRLPRLGGAALRPGGDGRHPRPARAAPTTTPATTPTCPR